jgi:hypothetical protein
LPFSWIAFRRSGRRGDPSRREGLRPRARWESLYVRLAPPRGAAGSRTVFTLADVPSLLAARHAAAQDALVAAGLEPARLFTVQGGERATKESGARIYFTVR